MQIENVSFADYCELAMRNENFEKPPFQSQAGTSVRQFSGGPDGNFSIVDTADSCAILIR